MAAVQHDDKGQGLAEYALIFVFVSIVAVAVIVIFGPAISSDLHTIGNSL
jgi:Flp pilus assembly pilin Flp